MQSQPQRLKLYLNHHTLERFHPLTFVFSLFFLVWHYALPFYFLHFGLQTPSLCCLLCVFSYLSFSILSNRQHSRTRANESFVRIQAIIDDWSSPLFLAIFSESCFQKASHSLPHPPCTVRTSGVKVPFSISLTLH